MIMLKLFSNLLVPIFFVLALLFCCLTSFKSIKLYVSNDDDYATNNYMRYDDFIYDDSIKSVLLYNTRSELSYPIINLQSGDLIKLSFDDLRRNSTPYNYTVIHCNGNWEPSSLSKSEYIEGFYEDEIFDYKYSTNTDLAYTHYNKTFPNDNMKVTKSGNYILKAYKVNDSEHPILTKRFMVVENRVAIKMTTKRATDVNESYFRQEIDFKINHEGYDLANAYDKLNVVLMQNYRWDNAITTLKPKFIKDTELNYDYNNSENVFDGNNEYRNFDIKSIKYQTIRIDKIRYEPADKIVHVHILPDETRSFKQYYSDQDLNGNFLIKKNEGNDSEMDADYVKVHFRLPYKMPLTDGNLYLFGKFSDWKFKEELKLDYDTLKQEYVKEVLLKQGYYNYMYCFVKDGAKNKGDLSVIEGSHYETENEYSILVYHRGVNDNYDRLIGFATVKNRD
jgi:hypothetical protein